MQSSNKMPGYGQNPFLLYLLTGLLLLSLVTNLYMWNIKNDFQLKYELGEHMQESQNSYEYMEAGQIENQLIECQQEHEKKDSLIRRKDSLIYRLDKFPFHKRHK
ncbi:hypothetical protein [Xanthocytophaga agilis]|uniref:Uncharacterized protein n=1 Tax=Xanthocytophaga agilis TaxID=3048010 RepID=A0AAE3R9F0_9BACT|nr:hypothetical protein [Xanthocytophaga agilis]MDJ1505685.1 hypothetical protein [Xanthocytophaga agilis]